MTGPRDHTWSAATDAYQPTRSRPCLDDPSAFIDDTQRGCHVGAPACLGDPAGRIWVLFKAWFTRRARRRSSRTGPNLSSIDRDDRGGHFLVACGNRGAWGRGEYMRSPETESGRSRRVLWIVLITVSVLLVAAVFTAIAWPARWRTIKSSVHDYRWWLALAAVVAVAILVLLLLNKLLQRPWGAPWRGNVLAAADALHYELDALPVAATPAEQALRRSVGEAVEHHLEAARTAAWPKGDKRLSVGEQFLDWWTSAP